MTSEWTLHILAPGEPARRVSVKDGLTIGRYPACDVVLNDRHVSSRHARVTATGTGFAITDLGSSNGTSVGEDVVLAEGEAHDLTDGLAVLIGEVEIRVEGPEPDEEEETAAADQDITAFNEAVVDPDSTRPAVPGDSTMAAPPPPAAPAPAAPPTPVAAPSPAPTPPRPPAPAPAPPSREPSHIPVPAQAPSAAYDPLDSNPSMTLLGVDDDSYGTEAKLSRMGAQLIVLNEADLRTVDITTVEFTIGRSSQASCRLDNRGVSSQHAKITFNARSNTFFVDDCESANGTHIDDAPVTSGSPRALHPDAHLRFGTIEAVFMQAVDANLEPVPTDRHEVAVRLLVGEGRLNGAIVKAARKRAAELDTSIGEVLLKELHVKPRDWTRAVDEARIASTLRKLDGRTQRQLMWAALVIVIGVALFLVLGK